MFLPAVRFDPYLVRYQQLERLQALFAHLAFDAPNFPAVRHL
jgi:hypothetical protein